MCVCARARRTHTHTHTQVYTLDIAIDYDAMAVTEDDEASIIIIYQIKGTAKTVGTHCLHCVYIPDLTHHTTYHYNHHVGVQTTIIRN